MEQFQCISTDVKLGRNVQLSKFVNLYGCSIGDQTKIGAFVEIQKNASVGKNCKISSHTFICEGVSIADNCFIGHSVVFINDNHPRATNPQGQLESAEDWKNRLVTTQVGKNVSIGSNATILGNVRIAEGALIGAGSVVTKDVPPYEVWVGNPAKFLRKVNEKDGKSN